MLSCTNLELVFLPKSPTLLVLSIKYVPNTLAPIVSLSKMELHINVWLNGSTKIEKSF